MSFSLCSFQTMFSTKYIVGLIIIVPTYQVLFQRFTLSNEKKSLMFIKPKIKIFIESYVTRYFSHFIVH